MPPADDGGSPRLSLDRASGRKTLAWSYDVGGGLLEAAGLEVGVSDSLTVFVVASSLSQEWPARGSKVRKNGYD